MIGRNRSCSSNRNRLVGSCINTLVSSTNSLVPPPSGLPDSERCLRFLGLHGRVVDAFSWQYRARYLPAQGWWSGPDRVGTGCGGKGTALQGRPVAPHVEGLNKIQYLLYMAWNLDAAPLAQQNTLAAENEGAALDAAHLFAIHVLHLDHPEPGAQLLFGVCEQVEGKPCFALKPSCDLRLSRETPRRRSRASGTPGTGRETAGFRWCSPGCCPWGRSTAPEICLWPRTGGRWCRRCKAAKNRQLCFLFA